MIVKFPKAFLPFLAELTAATTFEQSTTYFDPIDKCMQHFFAIFKQVSGVVNE